MNSIQKKIYNHLINDISQGRLVVNDRIDTELELSRKFGTNRMNAHYVIKHLEDEGVVRRNKKQGTFVSRDVSPYELARLKSRTEKKLCILNLAPQGEWGQNWQDKMLEGLKENIGALDLEIVFTTFTDKEDAGELEECLRRMIDEGVTALAVVSNLENEFILNNAGLLYQYFENIYVLERGHFSWQDWPFCTITVNMFGEGCRAGEYAIEKGYKNIVFCNSGCKKYWAEERLRGLFLGLRRASDGKLQPLVCNGNNYLTQILKLMKGREKCCLVAVEDRIAAEIINFLSSKGLSRNEYGIISFNDDPHFKEYNLTTFRPPTRRQGKQLAKLLENDMKSTDENATIYIKMDSELIERGSC